MQTKFRLKIFNFIFYTIIIYGAIVFWNNNAQQFSIKNYYDEFIILVVVLKFINFLLFNKIHFEIFQIYNLSILKIDNFKLTYKGYIGNFFGFGKSGTGYKAIFLKNKFNFSYLKFISYYILLQSITLFLTSFICLLFITFGNFDELNLYIEIIIALLLIMTISVFANYIVKVLSKIKYLNTNRKSEKFIRNVVEIAGYFKFENLLNRKFIKIIIINFLIQINIFLQIYLQANILNLDMSTITNLIYNLISQITIFISVTPNGVGIKEFFLITLNKYLNFSQFEVFELALLDRVTDFFSLLFFTALYQIIIKIYKYEK